MIAKGEEKDRVSFSTDLKCNEFAVSCIRESSFVLFALAKLTGHFVKLTVTTNPGTKPEVLLVNVNSLAKRLLLSKEEILESAKKGKLNDLLMNQQNYLERAKKATNSTDKNIAIPPEIKPEDLTTYRRAVSLLRFSPPTKTPAKTGANTTEIEAHTIMLSNRNIYVVKVPNDTTKKLITLFGK